MRKAAPNSGTPPGSIEDYAERNAAQREFWASMNGKQSGDPAKLAQALLTIAEQEQPPFRFVAGTDGIGMARRSSPNASSRSTSTANCRRRWP